jgi:hypothetical protein
MLLPVDTVEKIYFFLKMPPHLLTPKICPWFANRYIAVLLTAPVRYSVIIFLNFFLTIL